MLPVAAWLAARPLNGGLGLVLALILPMLTATSSGLGLIVGGLVMTHLVFANGLRAAALQGLAATLFLGALAFIVNSSVGQIVATAVMIWVPAIVLAALTLRLRSLTLVLQITVIIAMVGVLGIYVALGDPTDYWSELLTQWTAIIRDSGQTEYADQVLASKALIVPQMTMMAVFTLWSWLILVLLLGYGLYQYLPEKQAIFGRFSDLNYGRVLAAVMAVTSVVAVVTGAIWLQNLAFVAFVVFWLQGLAIMHWMHGQKRLPLVVLVVTYLLVPVLNGLLVIALAILGYLDAWFDFRTRRAASPV